MKTYTCGTLAKNTFFNKYYKNNIYTLTPSQDKFIRDYYFGGRCELFTKRGIIKGENYYYDFTRETSPWWIKALDFQALQLLINIDVYQTCFD